MGKYIHYKEAYKEAKAEGRLVILPCKIGDTIYWIENAKIKQGKAWQFGYENYLWVIVSTTKTKAVVLKADLIYLTKEEAEQAINTCV